MKKCLLCGFWGHHNLGDDLLLKESLKNIPKDYEIYMLNPGPYITDVTERKIRIVKSIIYLINKRIDLTIFNGGGIFPSTQYKFKSLMKSYIIYLISRKMVINGIGIVPKKGFFNNLRFSIFLNFCTYISVRDEVSRTYVNKLLKNKQCINCHDLYFGKELANNFTNCKNGVLVCLANPFNEKELQNSHFQERYKKLVFSIQKILLALKEKYGNLTFIPFYIGSDEKFINDVISIDSLKDSKICVPYKDFQLNEVDDIFASYKIALCMRFHSFVLSIRNNLPFIGICYDYKSESLLREIGLKEIGLRYGIRDSQFFGEERDLNDDELLCKFRYIENNYLNIIDRLEEVKIKFNSSVRNNYKKIYTLLKK